MSEKSTKINFPAPVFSSRVSRARMLIELSGKRFVWDAARGKYVLTDKRKAAGTHTNTHIAGISCCATTFQHDLNTATHFTTSVSADPARLLESSLSF